MPNRVLFRRDVPDDLESIVDYLDLHSATAGDRFLKNFYAAIEGLAEMPGKGSPKHFGRRALAGIRSWQVPGFRNFLIFYRPGTSELDVLAVFHGARNIRSLLLQRLG